MCILGELDQFGLVGRCSCCPWSFVTLLTVRHKERMVETVGDSLLHRGKRLIGTVTKGGNCPH